MKMVPLQPRYLIYNFYGFILKKLLRFPTQPKRLKRKRRKTWILILVIDQHKLYFSLKQVMLGILQILLHRPYKLMYYLKEKKKKKVKRFLYIVSDVVPIIFIMSIYFIIKLVLAITFFYNNIDSCKTSKSTWIS